MGSPKTYLDACRQVASHLTALGILARADAGARLKAIETRLEVLTRNATNRIAQARLCSTPVLVSLHQRDFCEWLGLRVVATFRPADTAAVSEIDEAIQAGMRASVKLVIANRPEGRRTADALAERLGARVVVFENFPALRDGRVSFDEMVMGNVELLSRAASVSQLAGVSLGPQDGPAEAQGRIILVVGRD
jgi:ABC-type Zn uptake system ZnuABC Zn-binding protein ZnuA